MNLKRKILLSIAISLILLSCVKTVRGKWWNASWSYRRRIDISSHGNELANYAVRVSINTSQLYAENKIQENCSDIRFTFYNSTSGYEVKIPYWVETCNITGYSTFWIKVVSIPKDENATIYVYYGNPNAISESNGSEVFLFFENFDDGDMSDWLTFCNLFDVGHDKGCSQELDASNYISPPYSLSLYAYSSCGSAPFNGVESEVSKVLNLPFNNYTVEFYIRSDVLDFDYFTTAYAKGRVYVNNTRLCENICSCQGYECTCTTQWIRDSFNQSGAINEFNLTGFSGDCVEARTWFDDVRIRERAEPEPTVVIGSEEVEPIPPLWHDASINSTIAGSVVEFRLRWTDNFNLSSFIFSLDNCTGRFERKGGLE